VVKSQAISCTTIIRGYGLSFLPARALIHVMARDNTYGAYFWLSADSHKVALFPVVATGKSMIMWINLNPMDF
jgi:hypothetical protein